MSEVSTWSEDCARGLDHPDSVAARMQRIVAANEARIAMQRKRNHAFQLLRETIRSPSDVVQLAAVCSSTLVGRGYPASDPAIELIDTFHDELEGMV